MTEQKDMMNCEEYREAVSADPSFDGGGSHVAQCTECQAWRSEIQALDAKIASALEIPVPAPNMPELPEIDTGNVTALPRRRFGAPTWLAVAATVTVAAFIGFRTFVFDPTGLPLSEQIVAHMDHEPYALRITDKAVSDNRLTKVVPASIATLDHSAGLITYAQSCKINGKHVPHLVIQGERGPITILLMPEEKVDGPEAFMGESINGVILPVGEGSIAIIGEEGEDLERVKESVRDSVMWST